MVSQPQSNNAMQAFYIIAMSYIETRLANLIQRLRGEVDYRVSFGRFYQLGTYAGFTKTEAKMLLPVLEARGIIRKNCVAVYILPEQGVHSSKNGVEVLKNVNI